MRYLTSKKLQLALCLALCLIVFSGCKAASRTGGSKDGANKQSVNQETQDEKNKEDQSAKEEKDDLHEYDFTICYTGDISLAEDALTTQNLDASANGISDCISPEFIKAMQEAEVTVINSEFQFSNQGSPLPNKMYTFRGNPERVKIYQELGVDIANLANNHVYDFGQTAMEDTFATLEGAGIPYIGAGRNLEEAKKPYYVEVQGKKIAFVAASRAEKYKMTPQATETDPGILRCYDTELFLEEIREAKANADLVIAYVHWGTEHTTTLEDVQLTTGKEYLDAGADVVVGAHSHCLQGMEYYNGKPIIYSLGNFWFDEYTEDTVLLQLHFSGNDKEQQLEVRVLPGIQTGGKTTYLETPEEQRELYDYLENISINVAVDDNGVVTERN